MSRPSARSSAPHRARTPDQWRIPKSDLYDCSTVIDVLVTTPADGVTVLHAVGDIDMLTAPVLDSVVGSRLLSGPRVLVLDLREVGFMSSAGLASLMSARARCTAAGVALRLVGSGDPVLRPLVVTGLVELFDVHRDLATALA